jgi:hypothetical protein
MEPPGLTARIILVTAVLTFDGGIADNTKISVVTIGLGNV